VDTMGCEMLADSQVEPKTFRYQTLLSLMLSSQTKDHVTSQAMKNLQQYCHERGRNGLTVDCVLQLTEEEIDRLICKVGFHQRKASFILRTTRLLKDKFNGDVPDIVEDLTSLPGVGPKMALLTLQVAWNKTVGIGVDVHVHRICGRLRWISRAAAASTPEHARKELEEWLPREYWRPINKLFVGFGQTICLPVKPKCEECKINSLCPSAFKV